MSDEPIETKVGGASVTIGAQAPAATPEKPSVAIVKNGAASFDVKDDAGRVITLKKPGALAGLDFTKAAGAGGVNQLYLAEIAHLKYVAAIDGDIVATPATDGQLRALYVRLSENSGNEAAQMGVYEHFMSKSPEEADADLKNA